MLSLWSMIVRSLVLIAAGLVAGCAFSDDASNNDALTEPVVFRGSREPVGVQLLRVMPALKTQPFNTLLDFETENDAVFLTVGHGGDVQMTADHAHTGRQSLRVAPGTRKFSVKLSSLLGEKPFPNDWTLVGGFFYCDRPVDVIVSVDHLAGAEPRTVTLSPGRWTLAVADLTGVTSRAHESAMLTFEFPARTSTVWCDDILLINNSQMLVDRKSTVAEIAPTTATATTKSTSAPAVATTATPWTIEKRGLSYVGDASAGFNFKLTTTEAISAGWAVDEANELRARFHSTGAVKQLTIYSDGRAYWDGGFKAMTAAARDDASLREEHEIPAEITIADELGRVDRNSPGDANNDGYNEIAGAYRIVSAGASRIEFMVVPHVRSMTRPCFEVRGLAAGKVLITSEGRLIEQSVRLDDGAVLFELPGRIDRPTQVNLRLQ